MINAQYTVVLKTLMDNEQTKAALNAALSTYPIYQPKKTYDMIPNREQLNAMLLNHYKYREIGFETVGRFLDELKITMCEIMPRYNELYKTVEIMADIEDPFGNIDIIETFKQTTTGNNITNQTTTSNTTAETTSNDTSNTDSSATSNDTTAQEDSTVDSKTVHTTTPQGNISIPANDIDSITYADDVNWSRVKTTNTNSATSTGSTSGTTTNTGNSTTNTDGETKADTESNSSGITEHTFHKKGNQGVNTYAHDMNEFRTSIIDITSQIINDKQIKELFLMVY